MAIDRDKLKKFKPNVKANTESTKRENIFLDIAKDTTARVRFLPVVPTEDNPDGLIFTRAENHYNVKGENGRGTALACLNVHGTEETGDDCYLCKLARILTKFGDKAEKEIGKSLLVSPRWYAQVLVAEEIGRDDNNKPILKYTGPRLLGLPKTGADAVTTIMNNMDMAGTSFFFDMDEGQDLMITRHSASPWYSADRSGIESSLDDIFPEWDKKMIENVYLELGLKVVTVEEQKHAAMRAFGDELDWAALAEEYGL